MRHCVCLWPSSTLHYALFSPEWWHFITALICIFNEWNWSFLCMYFACVLTSHLSDLLVPLPPSLYCRHLLSTLSFSSWLGSGGITYVDSVYITRFSRLLSGVCHREAVSSPVKPALPNGFQMASLLENCSGFRVSLLLFMCWEQNVLVSGRV